MIVFKDVQRANVSPLFAPTEDRFGGRITSFNEAHPTKVLLSSLIGLSFTNVTDFRAVQNEKQPSFILFMVLGITTESKVVFGRSSLVIST